MAMMEAKLILCMIMQVLVASKLSPLHSLEIFYSIVRSYGTTGNNGGANDEAKTDKCSLARKKVKEVVSASMLQIIKLKIGTNIATLEHEFH